MDTYILFTDFEVTPCETGKSKDTGKTDLEVSTTESSDNEYLTHSNEAEKSLDTLKLTTNNKKHYKKWLTTVHGETLRKSWRITIVIKTGFVR